MKNKYTEDVLRIAKFIDKEPIKGFNEHSGKFYYYYNDLEMKDYQALPFFNTWEDLMPVVIKIESFSGDENEFHIFGNCVQIGKKKFVGKTKIESVYKAVVWWINKNSNL